MQHCSLQHRILLLVAEYPEYIFKNTSASRTQGSYTGRDRPVPRPFRRRADQRVNSWCGILSALVYSCQGSKRKCTNIQMHPESGRCWSTWVPAQLDFCSDLRELSTPRGGGSAVFICLWEGAGSLRILGPPRLCAWVSRHPPSCPCQLHLYAPVMMGHWELWVGWGENASLPPPPQVLHPHVELTPPHTNVSFHSILSPTHPPGVLWRPFHPRLD